MEKTGRIFFALGLLALGIEHFVFQEFVVGRAPGWPPSIPGQHAWAYASGAWFILVSIAIITGRKARTSCVVSAALVFLWAFLRHIPLVANDSFLFGTWTAAGKALVFTGGALAVAGSFPKELSRNNADHLRLNNERGFIITGRICLGIFLVIAGAQHFLFVDFVASLIPNWFPGAAVFWANFAGATLIAGGVGLFIPATASWAAFLSGIMIFAWVWIVHLPRFGVSISDKIALFEALAFSGVAFVLVWLPKFKKA